MNEDRLESLSVLVTAIGAPGAVGIIRALTGNGERVVNVFGTDMRAEAAGRPYVKEFRRVPKGTDPSLIEEMTRVCKDLAIDVVLPLSTVELLPFASGRDRIFKACGTRVCISERRSIELSNEKGALFGKLESEGIPVPDHVEVGSIGEFKKACGTLGHPRSPVCMKPSFAHGSRGFRTIDAAEATSAMFLHSKPESGSISFNEAERLLAGLDEFPRMVVMEFLPGKEYSVDMLCSRGDLLLAVTRSRDEIRSGISFRGTTVDRPEAREICERICRIVKFDGAVGVQLREDAEGRLKVLEINPRLHGSVVLSVAAGANIPYLAVKDCLGEAFEIPSVKYGTKMTRFWGATFHDKDGLSYTL